MNQIFAPCVVTILPLALIFSQWVGVVMYVPISGYPIELTSAISSSITALTGSLLWARAAHDNNDRIANSAAAAVSGAAAAFAAGAMSIPAEVAINVPSAVKYIQVLGLSSGWILTTLTVVKTWQEYLARK